MTIAFDQNLGTNGVTSAATTITLTTAATAAVGSKIFVIVSNFAAADTLSSVGGGGLTWNVDLKAANGSERYAIASADAPAGLASGTVITATYTGSTFDRTISGFSATGVATGTTYDGTNTSTSGGGATWSSGAITTANANDIIVAGGTEDGNGTATSTPNGGWTEVADFNLPTSSEAYETVYQIVSATGTYTSGGTFSASGTVSVGLGVAYKAAGAASVTVIAPQPNLIYMRKNR